MQSSDQGDIFVYQPYTRNQASDGTIQASYSGSLNRGTFSIAAVQTNSESVAATPPPVPANAAGMPFVYTLRTVADGKLGTHVFSEALVTIRMWANSGTFSRKASSNGGFLYTNTGPATVSVIDGAWTRTATFSSNEIYVFYDTGIGVAGFGSRISPTYPIALDCVNTAYPSVGNYNTDCTTGDWWTNGDYYDGTLGALVDPIAAALGTGNDVANVGDYFPFLTPGDPGYNPLPQSLTRSTLLTGRAHTCAGVYTSDPSSGYLGVCSGPAPRGLRTNLGGFFLQDQSGVQDLGYDANVGALQVEVMSRD